MYEHFKLILKPLPLRTNMSTSVPGSLVDVLQLSTVSPKRPPRPRKQLRTLHRWSKEELSVVAYLRLCRSWSWSQIQRTFFPSMTPGAVRLKCKHISTDEHIQRAREASSVAINPRRIPEGWGGLCRTAPEYRPVSRLERSPPNFSVPSPTESNDNFATPSSVDTVDSYIPPGNHNTARRYNLRPSRPRGSQDNAPSCAVDRSQFPHFFTAWKEHVHQHTESDTDYVPPRSPTLELSDRSPSVISSQPSEASSLELFGLEVRPLSPSYQGTTAPGSPSEEFFTAEETPT